MTPLDKYRQKRNFAKTPEPKGSEAVAKKRQVKKKKLFFCVQKHLASHLHYDLRLEHRGVLMSWAVPKGPSLDPSVKRFAAQVEDHPVEYGTFEGVIPEGYGAGVVMLWDEGTWEPESEDIDAALTKGDLKFTLDGYKLKGSWVLIKTRYGGAPNSWLLIKHRDDWSGPIDITEFAPLSVTVGPLICDHADAVIVPSVSVPEPLNVTADPGVTPRSDPAFALGAWLPPPPLLQSCSLRHTPHSPD